MLCLCFKIIRCFSSFTSNILARSFFVSSLNELEVPGLLGIVRYITRLSTLAQLQLGAL